MSWNKGTELEDDPNELSLHERMLLITKSFQSVLILSGIVVLVCLGLSIAIIVIFQNPIFQDAANNPEINIGHDISDLAIIMALVCLFLIIWFFKNQMKNHKESERIVKEYTDQAYLLALSLSGREKDEDVSLNFYDIARDVFPELKKADIESVKKTGEELEVEERTVEDIKKGDYRFDVVSEIGSSLKFVVKHFEKKVTSDDLKKCCKRAGKEFHKSGSDLFRLVCLAEDFESNILKSYEGVEAKKNIDVDFPVDLILYNEKGFNVLKISEKSGN